MRVVDTLSADERLERDDHWMRVALGLARIAGAQGEVPVGCVIVGPNNTQIGEGHNLSETNGNAVLHAEIVALGHASTQHGKRLLDCTAYVTLEPCAMCAGAMVLTRVARVVYGCRDPKAGAIDTHFGIGKTERLNHQFHVTEGVLATESAALLQAFFRTLRSAK